ncbi:hypothetical protein H072_8107 [Dactylellina haptotyla CBS 200.50]|uniref:Amidase domain-containing protein n=1 Tax=Dactylellina haptotyla (strain CBS 200.50) TaxID=1284197 RepID=S8BFW4_DACHA|nr:hypothetical protein H072_8107 [Dactylellina haptotyla CBS 200.50]
MKELTVEAYHSALRKGATTVLESVQFYLQRCKTLDPTLKALICINPNAEGIAKTLDEKLQHILTTNTSLPALFGVCVIVKDTYATEDMPTTARCKSLAGFQTLADAPVVGKIKAAGGIIFAKANLHELSCQGVTLSSLGGQTLNPYDLTRTPGGSSGGTAAALAANLGMVGCGGDTMNSIRSPASACSIVGLRPTLGRVSTAGIIPVSWTQDAIGPMGRTVADIRRLFTVMQDRSSDRAETSSTGMQPSLPTAKQISTLRGLRIGILNTYFQSDPEETIETQQVRKVMGSAFEKLASQGVTLVHFDEQGWAIPKLSQELDVQRFEFKQNIDEFFDLNHGNLHEIGFRPLKEEPLINQVIRKDEFDRTALPPNTSMIYLATSTSSNPDSEGEYQKRLQGIRHLKSSLASKFQDLNVDIFAYPHQTQLVVNTGNSTQPNRNGLLASLSGHPSLCIPGRS